LAELGLADFDTEEVLPQQKSYLKVTDDLSEEGKKPSIVID